MRFPSLKFQLILVAALALSLLSGCIKNPPILTRFYILTPLDQGTGLAAKTESPLSVEIASLGLPQYLEKPYIVTRSSGNQLELAECHQWGGNLRKNMIRVMAQNLSQLLATPDISMAPFRPPIPPDFGVQMEVMQFERTPPGQVQLSVQWRLSRGRDKKTLKIQTTELVSPVIPDLKSFEPTVSAMSLLLGELSHIIAQEILHQASTPLE